MRLGTIIGGVVVLLLLFVLGGAVYTIDETERGVLLQNGAIISEEPIKPGLNFKLPIVQDVDTISVQSSKEVFEDIPSISKDRQSERLFVSVNYRIAEDKVIDIRRTYINEQNLVDRVLRPTIIESIKTVAPKYTAEEAWLNREVVGGALTEAIIAGLDNRFIIIESIQVEDIKLSEEYVRLLEDKAAQTLKVQTLEQIEQQQIVQARTTVVNAKAEADAQLARASAQAEAVRLQGQAEADAIEAKANALAKNGNLVQLTQAERWDGKLPTSIFGGSASGPLPILNVTPQAAQ